MTTLNGQVALVTGASRGVGKGVALGLGEAGATVYVTGRTVDDGQGVGNLPGTIHQTVDEVNRLGGHGVAIACDHRDDEQVKAVLARIEAAHGRLDILVNNVWGGYEFFWDGTEFWTEQGFWTMPLSRWDAMFQAGVRAHYVASVLAAPLMVARRAGLIVNISFIAAGKDDSGVCYGTAKAADDRMAACMAHDLRARCRGRRALSGAGAHGKRPARGRALRPVQRGVAPVYRACGRGVGGGPAHHAQVRAGPLRGGTRAGIRVHRHRWTPTHVPARDVEPSHICILG